MKDGERDMHSYEESILKKGFIRIKDVLKIIPVSRSTWYAGIKAGRFPPPVKLSERISAWRLSDILKLAESF